MKNISHRIWNKRQINNSTATNKSTTNYAVKDEDVIISYSIKQLEEMMEGVGTKTKSSFEKMFLPALIVFSLLAFGGFMVIYSITTDMSKLAKAMDPKMGQNMTQMVNSIDSLSMSVERMSVSVQNMDKNFTEVNQKMGFVVAKLNNLDSLSRDMSIIRDELTALKPMLSNMNHMNKSMLDMKKSMNSMDSEIKEFNNSFQKPMGIINSMPFM